MGLINPVIILPKIKMQSLLKIDGYYGYVTGNSEGRLIIRNAVNLCLKPKWTEYIKKLEKCIEKDVVDEIITKEDNLSLYDELVVKHTEGIYKNRPNSIGLKLKDNRMRFVELPMTKQVYVLTQILGISGILGYEADLRELGESKSSGTIKLNKNISNLKEFKIINQSITGIYKSQDIDLLNV